MELADIKLIIFKKKAMKCILINLFVIFLSLFPAWGYSQERQPEPERGSVLPGFIITLQGDTVKGYLLNINLWLNQKMTFFYTNPDDREGRVKYTPKEIRAYQVGPRYYESTKHPFTNSIRSENLWKEEFGKKKNEETIMPFNLKFLLKFARNMADYVKDDVELAQKIANKTEGYKNINIEAIIREYNAWYLNSHQTQ